MLCFGDWLFGACPALPCGHGPVAPLGAGCRGLALPRPDGPRLNQRVRWLPATTFTGSVRPWSPRLEDGEQGPAAPPPPAGDKGWPARAPAGTCLGSMETSAAAFRLPELARPCVYDRHADGEGTPRARPVPRQGLTWFCGSGEFSRTLPLREHRGASPRLHPRAGATPVLCRWLVLAPTQWGFLRGRSRTAAAICPCCGHWAPRGRVCASTALDPAGTAWVCGRSAAGGFHPGPRFEGAGVFPRTCPALSPFSSFISHSKIVSHTSLCQPVSESLFSHFRCCCEGVLFQLRCIATI